MKWSETTSSKCRYGEVAGKIWGDWDIIWEDAEDDYQGHASFVAVKGRKYCFYEWWYGSCSGCDEWESRSLSDEQIENEMRKTAMWLNNKRAMIRWLEMLEGNTPISNYSMEGGGGLAAGLDMLGVGILSRVNAIRKHFGMPEYTGKENGK